MNQKKLLYFAEILAEQINHWALFPVFMLVTGVASASGYGTVGSPNVLMWVLCSLFPLTFFILREKVENFLTFFLLHVAVGAASFLLPGRNKVESVLAVFFAACYMIYSFMRILKDPVNMIEDSDSRMKKPDDMTQPFTPIIAVIISVIAISFQDNYGEPGWNAVYVGSLVGVLALYVIYKYICNYISFLTVNESSASTMPASDMFRSGIILVSGYALFSAGLLLLAGNGGWVTSLREGLHSLFLWIARSIIQLIAPLSPSEEQPEQIVEAQHTAASGGLGDILPEKTGEPALIWQILEVAAIIAFVVFWLFLLYKGTIVIIEYVRGRFAANIGQKAYNTYNNKGIDVREKCEIEKYQEQKEKKSAAVFLSPYERVRRLYKKKVRSCASEIIEDTAGINRVNIEILNFHTARECADKLQLSTLADIYESTRYSDRETTKETVRQMKNVCR